MGEANSAGVVLQIITEFANEFRTVIDGNSNDLTINELAGGARNQLCLPRALQQWCQGHRPLRHGQGRRHPHHSLQLVRFFARPLCRTTAFEVIVKQQIKRLEDPALRCCSLVYDELVRILAQLLTKNASFRRSLPCASASTRSSSTFSKSAWLPPPSSSRTLSPPRLSISTPVIPTSSAATKP